MTTWLVTRHPGALAWARQVGIPYDHHVAHLDPADITPGDVIIGSLPVNLAAVVCQRGGRYFNLSLHLHLNDRGRELSAHDMLQRNAELEEFFIERRRK